MGGVQAWLYSRFRLNCLPCLREIDGFLLSEWFEKSMSLIVPLCICKVYLYIPYSLINCNTKHTAQDCGKTSIEFLHVSSEITYVLVHQAHVTIYTGLCQHSASSFTQSSSKNWAVSARKPRPTLQGICIFLKKLYL